MWFPSTYSTEPTTEMSDTESDDEIIVDGTEISAQEFAKPLENLASTSQPVIDITECIKILEMMDVEEVKKVSYQPTYWNDWDKWFK